MAGREIVLVRRREQGSMPKAWEEAQDVREMVSMQCDLGNKKT